MNEICCFCSTGWEKNADMQISKHTYNKEPLDCKYLWKYLQNIHFIAGKGVDYVCTI